MLEITISNDNQRLRQTHATGPLELGRSPGKEGHRIVVEDPYVSRDQLRIEQLSDKDVKLDNLGGTVRFADGREMARGSTLVEQLPVRLTIGFSIVDIAYRLDQEEAASPRLQTITPPLASLGGVQLPSLAVSDSAIPSADELTEWFETLLTVQRSAAGSSAFYDETAQAVVDLVHLDRGLVLLRDTDQWRIAASRDVETDGQRPQYSRKVLAQVVDQRRTFFRGIRAHERLNSLEGVETVVASPIFDPRGSVMGVVYGSRDLRDESSRSIGPFEAKLVQLLAAAVSAGLARVEQEAAATRMRVQFEGFFSPQLASELQRNPALLEGHDREITVLFCDIRSFSKISERLGAKQTYELLKDAMDRFTDCIMNQGGVMVDYHGDGLAAMWNAPADDPQHATKACHAAREMLAQLPELNERWQAAIGRPMEIGIGINTGSARVGNAGSSRRMKYGPLGHTVNLASRVEGATKQFGVPCLITRSTRNLLSDPASTRRVCQVRVVGIEEPVELFQYFTGNATGWNRFRTHYEAALACLERGEVDQATLQLDQLWQLPNAHADPTIELLSSRVKQASQSPASFDFVMQLTSK